MIADHTLVPLVIATANAHKVEEFRGILAGLPVTILSAAEAGIGQEVEETGATLEENARLKAAAYGAAADAAGLRCWILADDSGLMVDALGGEPGVHSNRWAGAVTAADRNRLLLERLRDVPPGPARRARFECAIALRDPTGHEIMATGTLAGQIGLAPTPHPRGGFGYDPIFYLPDRGCMLADLLPAEKDAISHRGRAGQAARAILERALKGG